MNLDYLAVTDRTEPKRLSKIGRKYTTDLETKDKTKNTRFYQIKVTQSNVILLKHKTRKLSKSGDKQSYYKMNHNYMHSFKTLTKDDGTLKITISPREGKQKGC